MDSDWQEERKRIKSMRPGEMQKKHRDGIIGFEL